MICASHIAVFETIVKNLLRQKNLPQTTSTTDHPPKAGYPQVTPAPTAILSAKAAGNHRSVTVAAIQSTSTTNASFHSCINVRVYKGRLPQATTLRYLKPLSRICRQGLPPVRRNPFLGSSRCPASASRIQLSRILRQPQISRCRRNPKHIDEYGYECIISCMYKR